MIKKLIDLLKADGIAIKKEYIQNILTPTEGYHIEYNWKLRYFKLDISNQTFKEYYIASTKKEVINWINHNISTLLITNIQSPIYTCMNNIILNEYEVRCIQAKIAQKSITPEIATAMKITDSTGKRAIFNEDGTLKYNLKGFEISSLYTLTIIRERRKNSL